MSKLLSDFNETGRINSNVARTRIFSDLSLAFSINPISKDVNPVTDIEAVKNAIKNLVLTNFHDRPFNPTLGSGLTALLFEPATVFTRGAIKNAILKVINNHEPRVSDIDVKVQDDSERNAYRVTVIFRVFYNDIVNDVEFFLTRLR
jgi:phage baseplate assembly protein W